MQRFKLIAAVLALSSTQVLAQAGPSNELVLSLYNQLEALQSEVQTLRGLVEEQGYQLRRLEDEAQARYQDLDQRLVEQQSTAPRDAPPPAAGVPATLTPQAPANPAPPASPASLAGTAPLSEQDQYRTALSLLLDQGNSQTAVVEFQRYIDSYPNGALIANALYWQGEALLLLAEYSRARDQFERVLREFPDHQKASGAMLKLGVAYDQLGERARAEQLWRDLPTRYPGSVEEIGHAQRYLGQPR